MAAYGNLSLKQQEALRPFVAGRQVHDLGAGSLELTRVLLALGASSVVAVDRDYIDPDTQDALKRDRVRGCIDNRIELVASTFASYKPATIDVAFVSWPLNNEGAKALVPLLEMAKVVIYLGKNTDGMACGHASLFNHTLARELLLVVGNKRNDLFVVGAPLRAPRKPTLEERAGIAMWAGAGGGAWWETPQFDWSPEPVLNTNNGSSKEE